MSFFFLKYAFQTQVILPLYGPASWLAGGYKASTKREEEKKKKKRESVIFSSFLRF